jgi:AcrR family transcriptional regulator
MRMVRLTRVQQQARTRSAILTSARSEFEEHGFADAKVDRIAERADLTRGAVYSNFPGKRSLYLAVLLDAVRPVSAYPRMVKIDGRAEAAGEFARAWLDRLPLTGDSPAGGRLRSQSLAGVFEDEPGRTAMAEIAHLETLLLALVLEQNQDQELRGVRLAELIFTMLHGAGELARSAPGFGDPFDVVQAVRHLADLDLADRWDPPHLPFVRPAIAAGETWAAPAGLTDALTGRPVNLSGDRILAVLGSARLSAAEEAIRAGRDAIRAGRDAGAEPGEARETPTAPGDVTIATVTADPAETGALIRLRLADLVGCLPAAPPPRLSVVLDDQGSVAAAVGATTADGTETAVRIRAGAIVARATGRGAAHAVAAR